MRCFTKKLTILVWLLLSLPAAYAANEKVDRFPYGNLKAFPHWMIGCDNLDECSALGYPYRGKDRKVWPWHIIAKWKKGADDVTFSVSQQWFTSDPHSGESVSQRGFIEYAKKRNASLSFQLCADSGQCRPIAAQDKLQISAQTFGEMIIKTVKFTLNMKELTDKSYLISTPYKSLPLYFKDFLENYNNIKINYMPHLGGKQKIYKITHLVRSPNADYIKKYYPQFPASGLNDDNYSLILSNIVTYENGDKFIFACHQFYGTLVAKYDGKIYQPFPVVDATNLAVLDGLAIGYNSFGRAKFYSDATISFEVSNELSSLGITGNYSYDFAYNGKSFIVVTIRYMPVNTDIPSSDWPVLYKRPS